MMNNEEYKLLVKITTNLCGIFDGLADELGGFSPEEETYQAIIAVEEDLNVLLNSYEENTKEETDFEYHKNCVMLRNTEDSEIIVKTYKEDKTDTMMRDVSKIICFSDCDDTWEVIKIVYMGREIEYTGWQPGMVMSYEFTATGDEAWSGCFPQWDHQTYHWAKDVVQWDYVCSRCKEHSEYATKFCPNCGAKMSVPEGQERRDC